MIRLRESTATEAPPIIGDAVAISEAAVRGDGTATVRLIAPGWGSSGYYSAEVLERDGPGVFHVGLQMFWDHPTVSENFERPERSLRDLAGVLITSARWVDESASGGNGAGLYADIRMFEPYRSHLDELAPHIGVSIRAFGEAIPGEAQGRQGNIITALTSAESVDFVTQPGAGGAILQLFEAARPPHDQGDQRNMPETLERELTEARTQVRSLEDRVRTLEESERTLNETVTTLTAERDEARTGLANMAEGLRRYQAVEAVAEIVAANESVTDLPEAVRTRIAEAALPAGAPIPATEAGEVDRDALAARVTEAATREVAYIEALGGLNESGRVTGMGGGAGAPPDSEKISESLVRSFRAMGLSESAAKIAAGGR